MPRRSDAYEAFRADLLAAVPDDRRQTLEEVLSLDTVNSKLREGVLARSDYSRSMDALREERQALEREVAEARTKIEGWQVWYNDATRDYAEMQSRLNSYETEYGELEGRRQNFLTKEEYTAELGRRLEERDQLAIRFADVLTDLKLDHKAQFGEKLNTNELITYAQRQGLPLEVAYERFVAPRVDEMRKQEYEENLKKAREEGAREYAAQHQLPVSPSPAQPHALDLNQSVPANSGERVRAAVAAWNSSPHTP
jgi:hypothetical protein